jgi:hypothetical protein
LAFSEVECAMKPTPEMLYLQIGWLVRDMPEFPEQQGAGITPEMNSWLAKAVVLVELTGNLADEIVLSAISNRMGSVNQMSGDKQAIAAVVNRALAKAEMLAPASISGKFITSGHTFDAFAAVGKVLGRAKRVALFVDPFADHKLLEQYALLAPEGIAIRVLTTSKQELTLLPAAEHWRNQFGASRPLEIRFLPSRYLHDRYIFVDGTEAWSLGQSFNALAARAHTTIERAQPDTEALKVEAFASLWEDAIPPVARVGGQ